MYTYPNLSIMVWMPGQQKYFCLGSNGRRSTSTNADGTGCGGVYNCPGCLMDPLGEGT